MAAAGEWTVYHVPGHERHAPVANVVGGRLLSVEGSRTGHPECPLRMEGILEAVRAAHSGRVRVVEVSRLATDEELLLVHEEALVRFLDGAHARAKDHIAAHGPGFEVVPGSSPAWLRAGGAGDLRRQLATNEDACAVAGAYCYDTCTPVGAATAVVARQAAAACIDAARALCLNDEEGATADFAYVAVRPPGHHATRGHYGGFCYFNNAALAARVLAARCQEQAASITVMNRLVDQHVPDRESYEVVDDYDCMLSLTKSNVTKFFHMQMLRGAEDEYFVYVRLGIVGEEGQKSLKRCNSYDDACAKFEKKYFDKTRNQWDQDPFEPFPNKYIEISLPPAVMPQQKLRVAVLDLDYHHGNGTQDIFYDTDDVLFCSVHASPDFDYPHYSGHEMECGVDEGFGFNRNFPLPKNATYREHYVPAIKEMLKLVRGSNVAAIVVSLGLDAAKGDPVGTFSLEPEDYLDMGQRIAKLDMPTLVVQEGGYHPDRSVLG
eukprot:CAMPEP_0114618870 /NCGR_PEP_ID=MMETSP0168-20121206/7921_1 /TAXON_ID=95228 ORGANISM="Vannella sp., Strain DIVA3 517/6/12" /NCGR_SAMPLE_ID=MMETSP0168 /ASSEMBLY_ACC=CAM_ASM_000044 /LENGTH=491 /DNA_ID=CAMNT_0001830021 /DNA_START=92 /DNA_END=1563 /DNA_ORIENTATION=-